MNRVVFHFLSLPRLHKLIILFTVFISSIVLLSRMMMDDKPSQPSLAKNVRHELVLPNIIPPTTSVDEPKEIRKTYTVRKGDTLAGIFAKAGLSPQDVHAITQVKEAYKKLRKLMPGDNLILRIGNNDNEFLGLEYPYNQIDTLHVELVAGELAHRTVSKEIEIRTAFAEATIDSNFWNAASNAGLAAGQIMEVAGIFGWDIDFALDLRKGDSFSILFEQKFINGQHIGFGNVLAAVFINQGDNFHAYRFDDGEYYNLEGRSMRKAFLRAPVDFTRVSSNFNPRRLHPVTGRVRPHNGVDYAAAIGTPVQAAGNGRVTKSGYSKYNGNYVFIKHNSTYTTKYLHLHRRKVKTGQTVKQGQVIGTVGKTGRVTGAHLHYEFIVNGVHRNPRSVAMPKAKPIKASQKEAFLQLANQRYNELKLYSKLGV